MTGRDELGRAKISARDGLIIWMSHSRAGFEPRHVVGFAVDRIVANPHLSLLHGFNATSDNAETLLPGTANPRRAPRALL
jgi:hypothetical protein